MELSAFFLVLLVTIPVCIGIGYLIGHGRPQKMPDDVAQTVKAMSSVRRILVPIRGFDFEQRAVELACRLGEHQPLDHKPQRGRPHAEGEAESTRDGQELCLSFGGMGEN